MRHKVAGRLFGRTANQRKALLRGLLHSLIQHQKIETTLAKAKEIRKIAEKVISMGIKGDLHSKRLALSYVPDRAVMSKLFAEIAPRFSGRNGGYLRIVKTRTRVNDRAQMAVLEFIDYEPPKKAEKKKTVEKPPIDK
ncbi:MAG: 50S ribosomal protein L17 [Nitrospirae bacterium]|nr:50S ribosomal protein L17 [Nitrospirota bacterium]